MEVKSNFIKDGNEYADFEGLNNDQIESVKWNCKIKKVWISIL